NSWRNSEHFTVCHLHCLVLTAIHSLDLFSENICSAARAIATAPATTLTLPPARSNRALRPFLPSKDLQHPAAQKRYGTWPAIHGSCGLKCLVTQLACIAAPDSATSPPLRAELNRLPFLLLHPAKSCARADGAATSSALR